MNYDSELDSIKLKIINHDSSFASLEEIMADIVSVLRRVEVESRRQIVKSLSSQIARYGDDEIVYHNGEAVVPVSKVQKELTGGDK